MKKYFIIALFSIVLVACGGGDNKQNTSASDKKYIDAEVDPETYKRKKDQLSKLDEKTASLVENIFKARGKVLLYYEATSEDGSIKNITANERFGDKRISYTKDSLYQDGDLEDMKELVGLNEGDDALYINIFEKMYYKDTKKNRGIKYTDEDLEYPDASNLSDKLIDNTITDIQEEDGNTRIDFSNGTYSIYNKNYVLLEETQHSGDSLVTIKLIKEEENPEEVYDYYKSLVEDYLEEDSLASINWYPDQEYEKGNLVRKHPRKKP